MRANFKDSLLLLDEINLELSIDCLGAANGFGCRCMMVVYQTLMTTERFKNSLGYGEAAAATCKRWSVSPVGGEQRSVAIVNIRRGQRLARPIKKSENEFNSAQRLLEAFLDVVVSLPFSIFRFLPFAAISFVFSAM